MRCKLCRQETGGCRNGKHFKESQGCYGPKHNKWSTPKTEKS